MKSLRVLTDVAFPGVSGLAVPHPSLRFAPFPRLPRPSPARDFSPTSGTIPPHPPSCVKMAEKETLTLGFCIASWVELSACSSVECSFRQSVTSHFLSLSKQSVFLWTGSSFGRPSGFQTKGSEGRGVAFSLFCATLLCFPPTVGICPFGAFPVR